MAFLLTILGIGLILFIHEGGHFIAARICGVRVLTFSLGFGPRVFGFRKGDTDYRISLIWLGGYVRLDGEEMSTTPRPGQLGAATPFQRFWIFSGGILMNFLFALLVVPLLFRAGIPFEAPVVGSVEAGSPAWEAGIQPGARLLEVNEQPIYAFRNFAAAVALNSDAPLKLKYAAVGSQEDEVATTVLKPEYDTRLGMLRVGIGPAMIAPSLQVTAVAEDGPAFLAGLRSGDRLTAVNGVAVQSPFEANLLLQQALLNGGAWELAVWRIGQGLEDGPRKVSIPSPAI
ncbi:MAG: site-2 protease family protein, partial [Planctomycetes bacterium]|nr:site-2 protease family protein [Planctomycetota bacterium]